MLHKQQKVYKILLKLRAEQRDVDDDDDDDDGKGKIYEQN